MGTNPSSQNIQRQTQPAVERIRRWCDIPNSNENGHVAILIEKLSSGYTLEWTLWKTINHPKTTVTSTRLNLLKWGVGIQQ